MREQRLRSEQKEIPKEVDLKSQDIPIDVIYEDDDIIVVNKEKGMLVHPGARKSRWYPCKCNNGKI